MLIINVVHQIFQAGLYCVTPLWLVGAKQLVLINELRMEVTYHF